MATLTTMTTNVAAVLGLNATDDQTQIWQALNRGVRDMLLRTHCYVTSATAATVAGTSDYTLDVATLAIRYVYVTGESQLLEAVGAHELLRRRLNGSASDTATVYALQGSNLLMLYPTPDTSGTLTLYHVPQPTEMSSGSHDPSNATYGGIPDEYHEGLELYACWKLGDLRDDQSSAQGERYRKLYEGDDGRGGFLRRMVNEMKRKQGLRMGPARVGRQRPVLSSPSADVSPWAI